MLAVWSGIDYLLKLERRGGRQGKAGPTQVNGQTTVFWVFFSEGARGTRTKSDGTYHS